MGQVSIGGVVYEIETYTGDGTLIKEAAQEGDTGTGIKMDAGKSQPMKGIIGYFPRALLEVCKVSEAGARKYSWKGWEGVPNGLDRYTEAMGRHIFYEAQGQVYDDGVGGTGCLHAAQVAWNALARLELLLREKEGSGAEGST